MYSPNLSFRKLQKSDYHKNYIQLLSQLTTTGNISENEFSKIFNNLGNNTHIYVYEDVEAQKIIASATIILEQKFIHNGGIVAHLEDVVVDSNSRRFRIGQKLIQKIINIAKENKCYKIIADCKPSLIPFYEKNNFEKKGEQIAIYF